MIRTLALKNDDKLVKHIQLDQIHDLSIQYYWIDFNCPSEEEAMLLHTPSIQEKGISYLAYSVMDKVVDEYFPTVYQIEDELNDIENIDAKKSISVLMEDVFKLRSDLLKIRRTILPMRDLLYRVINSERLDVHPEQKRYFKDVYDHLLK